MTINIYYRVVKRRHQISHCQIMDFLSTTFKSALIDLNTNIKMNLSDDLCNLCYACYIVKNCSVRPFRYMQELSEQIQNPIPNPDSRLRHTAKTILDNSYAVAFNSKRAPVFEVGLMPPAMILSKEPYSYIYLR